MCWLTINHLASLVMLHAANYVCQVDGPALIYQSIWILTYCMSSFCFAFHNIKYPIILHMLQCYNNFQMQFPLSIPRRCVELKTMIFINPRCSNIKTMMPIPPIWPKLWCPSLVNVPTSWWMVGSICNNQRGIPLHSTASSNI